MTSGGIRKAARWGIGWDYFQDVSRQHLFDRRRRTTKLFYSFRVFANKMIIVNALLLGLNYLLLIQLVWPSILPSNLASLFNESSAAEHIFHFFRAYVSAQLMLFTLSQLYKRIIAIVVEDHA